jgi:hypothetical protein
MRIGNIASLVVSLYNNEATRKRALYLTGASGIGKSQVVYQAAEELGLPIVDLRLAQMDPVDLRGVPSISNGRTVWNPPVFFPDPKKQPAGILFCDEVSSAVPAVQAVAYQLFLDRAMGEYQLPDGWMIIAAGNRASDRGVTYTMAAPLMNRMTILDVETTLTDFRDWWFSQGKRPEVAAFLSDRADFLHKYDKESYGKQFPSPRGWSAVDDILAMDFPEAVRVEMLVGAVGHEAATTFEQFLRVWGTLPSLDKIFKDPDSVDVPDATNLRYCLAMGIAARVDRKTFNNAWAFLRRLPKEFQTLTVKLAYQRDPSIAQATKFGEWASENIDAFKRG